MPRPDKLLSRKLLRAVAKAATGTCDDHDYDVNVDGAVASMLAQVFESKHHHDVGDPQAPKKPGVYAIYERGKRAPVYVGKAARSLRGRLGDHARKIAGTQQLSGKKYECGYLAIREAWWVVLAESFLIAKYRPPWNGAGFAGHVPGVGRPGIKKSLWQQYLDGELTEEQARARALPSEE